jgi:HNH endonuclease
MSRRKFTLLEKSFIQERAKFCCEYCRFPMFYSHDGFHIEHIIPIRLGGSNELENLALACDGCNTNKRSYIEWKDPETRQIVPLFNPRQSNWNEHFKWQEDYTFIIANTPVGGATIDLLKMNRLGLRNIRQILRMNGVLPI